MGQRFERRVAAEKAAPLMPGMNKKRKKKEEEERRLKFVEWRGRE